MKFECNKPLIPVKLFYLTFYAAIASIGPYLSHFLQQRGFSSGDVSTILGVVPFVILMTKPFMGHFSDKTGHHKAVVIFCLIVSGLFLSAIYLVEPIHDYHAILADYNTSIENITLISNSTHFGYYQFWMTMVLIIVANSLGLSPCYTIMDTVTIDLLKDHPQDFGKQKMWMAVGSASAIFTISAIMDHISEGPMINYIPAFVSYIFCIMCAVVCVLFVKPHLNGRKKTEKGLKNFLPVLKRWKVLLFYFMTFILGSNFAKSEWMTVWYLKELGAQQINVAIAILITSAATMTSSFFSGFIITRLGTKMCITLSLLAYGLRNGLWITVSNSWYGVPIELLTGFAIGLWLPTKVSFAFQVAPYGSEATSQSIISGVYDGLGTGMGSLASGWLYFYYGGVTTLATFSAVTTTLALIYLVIVLCTDRHQICARVSDVEFGVIETESTEKMLKEEQKKEEVLKEEERRFA